MNLNCETQLLLSYVFIIKKSVLFETELRLLRVLFIYLSNKNLFKKLKIQIPMLTNRYHFEKDSSYLSKHCLTFIKISIY